MTFTGTDGELARRHRAPFSEHLLVTAQCFFRSAARLLPYAWAALCCSLEIDCLRWLMLTPKMDKVKHLVFMRIDGKNKEQNTVSYFHHSLLTRSANAKCESSIKILNFSLDEMFWTGFFWIDLVGFSYKLTISMQLLWLRSTHRTLINKVRRIDFQWQ